MKQIFLLNLSQHQILMWIYDLLAHAAGSDAILSILETIFGFCRHFRLKLNASKCLFFLGEAKYCGRLYSANGVRHDPGRLDALLRIPQTTTVAHLMQFLCESTWASSHVPNFERHVRRLRDRLEYLLTGISPRSKCSARRLSILCWTEIHESSFHTTLNALANSVALSHPKDCYDRCLFTDASCYSYSIIITKFLHKELSKQLCDQIREP